ncbi:MAG: hypothetical protein ACOYNR_02190 [Blastocatellia bacterium]|jgi:hypothetical protein
MNGTALEALQRTLRENREAKRQLLSRLAEIEAESAVLRRQLASQDAVIEQTEQALLLLLFPAEPMVEQNRPEPPRWRPASTRPVDTDDLHDLPFTREEARRAAAASIPSDDLSYDLDRLRRSDNTGNVRFTDFRIPQAATIVLREANRPLHVSEIYRRLQEGGFEFRGQHQLVALAVSLNRSKRFRKVAPGTFELDPTFDTGQPGQVA